MKQPAEYYQGRAIARRAANKARTRADRQNTAALEKELAKLLRAAGK